MSALVVGCGVDVELEGKRCPCVEGFVCDQVSDTCVRRTCTPKVTASDFRAAWATTNSIHWIWTPEGDVEDVLRYEVWVAPSQTELGQSNAVVYGPDRNPELGNAVKPIVGGVVNSTTTRGLPADEDAVAQLRIIDTDLCEYGSDLVANRTLPDLPSTLTLFRDIIPDGAELAPDNDSFFVTPDAGGAHLEYHALDDPECNPEVADTDDIRAVCGQPLRVRGLNRSLVIDPEAPAAGGLAPSSLATAFLEMRVANEAPVHSFFSVAWLRFGDCFSEEALYRWDGWTLRADGQDVLVQIPLSILRKGDGTPLTFEAMDTNAGGPTLCSFALGAGWHKTSIVRVDDVIIRY